MCDRHCCSMFWCTLYMLSGIGEVGLGVWLMLDPRVYYARVIEDPDMATDHTRWLAIIGSMLGAGTYCFICGVVGMAGVGCSSRGTLITFLVLGSLGMAGSLVCAGMSTTVYVKDLNNVDFAADIKSNLDSMYVDSNATNDYTLAWNFYQYTFECCGYDSYTDYADSSFNDKTDLAAPWSCCVREDDAKDVDVENILNLELCREEAAENPPEDSYFNPEGCSDTYEMFYYNQHLAFLGVTWAAGLLQLIAIIVSGCLSSDPKVESWTL